jgi:hypothetical protein
MKLRCSNLTFAAAFAFLLPVAACSSNDGGGTIGAGGGMGGSSAVGSGGASATDGGQSTGTGGSGGGSTRPATFETVKAVLQGGGPYAPCISCHVVGGASPPSNPLILSIDGQLYTNLTTHISKDCGNNPVVNPGKPNQSALVQILKGPCSAVTLRMPLGCTDDQGNCIPADYIAAIAQWIANGAPQN